MLPLKQYLFEGIGQAEAEKIGFIGVGDKSYHQKDYEMGMPEDDDINYLLIQYKLLMQYGTDFTTNNVATIWLDSLPVNRLYTAEQLAYRNLVNGINPPLSALYCNPYREWIGALIRADLFGYINPGKPALAAKLAYQDARLSHVKNGIYGAMWVAGLIALSIGQEINPELIYRALDYTPEYSRFYSAIETVLNWFSNGLTHDEAINQLHIQFSENNIHHWCHVIPNAMIITIALLWGGTDFEKALTISLLAGFDTDSNTATIGSILGYAHGTSFINPYWVNHLHDTIQSSVTDMNRISIRDFATDVLDNLTNFT